MLRGLLGVVTPCVNLDDSEDLDSGVVLCDPIVVVHVLRDTCLVVVSITHRDVGAVSVVVDVDAHLILSVGVDVLLDVFLCCLLVGEELAGGVAVTFEQAADSVDYCILFHGVLN